MGSGKPERSRFAIDNGNIVLGKNRDLSKSCNIPKVFIRKPYYYSHSTGML